FWDRAQRTGAQGSGPGSPRPRPGSDRLRPAHPSGPRLRRTAGNRDRPCALGTRRRRTAEPRGNGRSREGSVMTFPLGRVLATPGALAAFEEAGEGPFPYLSRHLRGEWGEVDQEDGAANDRALKTGSRLLSAYILGSGKRIWII